jgi:hypothetical protein
MTARPPVCDGHQGEIAPGANYATVVWPGAPDKHLCRNCAGLVWRYLPDLVRHRAASVAEATAPRSGVRDLARSLDLPAGLKPRGGR